MKKDFLAFIFALFTLLYAASPSVAASSKAKLLTDTSTSATTVPYINAGPAEDSTAATALGVQVNGTERMRVTATGSVGIGTTTPAATEEINRDLKVGTASRTCTAALAGTIQYTASGFTGCNGTTWVNLGGNGTIDPCAATSPAAGALCADGTVYVGLSPDTNAKMYAMPCDLGMSGTKGACTGTRSTYTWNDGSNNWVVTGYTSLTTGKVNTAGLVALGTTTSPAPYRAARACASQTYGGHSDWYLPAQNELNMFWTSAGSTSAGVILTYGNSFDVSGTWYWTSSEYANSYAYIEQFSDGTEYSYNKNVAFPVRCVRR